MKFSLKVDPRKAKQFADYALPSGVLNGLKHLTPLPIQSKILALNGSGISVYARSVPNQGKTTAAILSILSTPRQMSPLITNLILVPTPALADHYREQVEKYGGRPEHCRVIYRTGSIDEDELQHENLMTAIKKKQITSLIATPQRLLDYISADPTLLALHDLRQIVIDELDVFGSTSPLETLIEHVLQYYPENNPILTFMTTHSNAKEFTKIPQLIEKKGRPLYEASEPEPEWHGNLVEHTNMITTDIPACAKRIQQVWTGPGLVIPPPSVSASQLQNRLTHLEGAVVVQPTEVAGLHVENLENIYILASEKHRKEDIERLKWSLTNPTRNLHLISSPLED